MTFANTELRSIGLRERGGPPPECEAQLVKPLRRGQGLTIEEIGMLAAAADAYQQSPKDEKFPVRGSKLFRNPIDKNMQFYPIGNDIPSSKKIDETINRDLLVKILAKVNIYKEKPNKKLKATN